MDVNKFLFKGQPGTGKVAPAKIIAKILNRKLLKVDCQSLISEKPGQSPRNLAQAFYEINNYPHPKQIIVLLEGIDAIASNQDDFLKGLDSLLPRFTIIATANSI
jgi:AAA+ superfamily predicted ATPase